MDAASQTNDSRLREAVSTTEHTEGYRQEKLATKVTKDHEATAPVISFVYLRGLCGGVETATCAEHSNLAPGGWYYFCRNGSGTVFRNNSAAVLKPIHLTPPEERSSVEAG